MDWSSLTLGEERGCFADDCHNTQPGKLPPEIPLRAAGGILMRRGFAVALLLSAVSCYLCGEVCRSWFVSGTKMLVVQELSWKGLQYQHIFAELVAVRHRIKISKPGAGLAGFIWAQT